MVKSQVPDNFLLANTTIFAQNVCQSIEEMAGMGYLIKKGSTREESFTYSRGMTVFINYYGSIQGDYLLSMDLQTAAKLTGVWREGFQDAHLRDSAETCNGILMEMLNAAVGRSIVQLEKQYHDLNYVAANVVHGEIFFPRSMSGGIAIEGRAGTIMCVFAINLVTLKIARKLEESLKTIQKLTKEEQ
jgi:CheY-specific phosphatase CheX